MIEACGWRWAALPWGLAVTLDNGQYVFPGAKAWKWLKHDPEDSILRFFNLAVASAGSPDSSDGPLVEPPDSV